MKCFLVKPASQVRGELILPGDKSIASRSIIISAISRGETIIENFPDNKDCFYTIAALKSLGIKIEQISKVDGLTVRVFGRGLYGLSPARGPIFVGDSGTTLRIILGVLSGQGFETKLITGKTLLRRPMLRIAVPLRMMGAQIKARSYCYNAKHGRRIGHSEEYPPIRVKGGMLNPITYKMPVASAQVKSAILLAALYADGKTEVIEPVKTRDHTERMLKLFGTEIKVKQNKVVINSNKELVSPGKIYVPGDISSASFFLVLAAILQNSRIVIKNVGLNPSRMGIIRVLKRMGIRLRVFSQYRADTKAEPIGEIIVTSSKLKGTVVKREEVPSLIDELPVLMVAACFARGKTVLNGVGELRVKETDRIRSMSENLIRMGADITVYKSASMERIVIKGVKGLVGARVKSFGDHRTAMSMIVAGLLARGETAIDDTSCINKSFPSFLNILSDINRSSELQL